MHVLNKDDVFKKFLNFKFKNFSSQMIRAI